MYLSVGEISKILGISTETIRHYVQEGIITPHKNTANNYWEYSSDDFIRLTDVLFYRSMGLSVKEIKTIMGGAPIEELGDIIKIRRAELIKIIKETVDMMQRLDDWEECYWSEIGLLGKSARCQSSTAARIIFHKTNTSRIHFVGALSWRERIGCACRFPFTII